MGNIPNSNNGSCAQTLNYNGQSLSSATQIPSGSPQSTSTLCYYSDSKNNTYSASPQTSSSGGFTTTLNCSSMGASTVTGSDGKTYCLAPLMVVTNNTQ